MKTFLIRQKIGLKLKIEPIFMVLESELELSSIILNLDFESESNFSKYRIVPPLVVTHYFFYKSQY